MPIGGAGPIAEWEMRILRLIVRRTALQVNYFVYECVVSESDNVKE
jgi:hypothetical protein